jgi:putative MATE family efflux protein
MPISRTDQDLDRSPYRTIWTLSWPQILMMVFHFLIGFVDVWAAGRINREVQASLGIITQSLFFFLILATAVANGGVAAIGQSLGAKKPGRAQRYVGLCLLLAAISGSLILAVGLPLRHALLNALQVPDPIRPVTEYFLFVFLLLLPPYYLLIILNAVFRARKQVLFPLYSMAVVTLVNTLGDLGLGLGWWGLPRLGFAGLAWATFGSITLGAAVNVVALWKEGLLSRSTFAPWRWVRCALPYLWKVGWPSVVFQVVWHSGYLVLYAITASLPYGSVVALAGMSAGLRVESLLFLPAFALNMTAGILVGHSLGAGRFQEAKSYGYRILLAGLAMVTVMALVLWQVLEPVAAFLAPDPAVAREAVNYLFWNLLAIPFTLTSMVLAGAFNGAGAAFLNMLTMGLATWGLRLPLAYVLGHEVFESATGVWISMLASQAVQSSFLLYIFAFKDWSCHSMIKPKHCNTKETAHESRL